MNINMITGHAGSAHVTAAEAAMLNVNTFGTGMYILPWADNFAVTSGATRAVIGKGLAMIRGYAVQLQQAYSFQARVPNIGYWITYAAYIRVTRTSGKETAEIIVEEMGTGTGATPTIPIDPDVITSGEPTDPYSTTNDCHWTMPLYQFAVTRTGVNAQLTVTPWAQTYEKATGGDVDITIVTGQSFTFDDYTGETTVFNIRSGGKSYIVPKASGFAEMINKAIRATAAAIKSQITALANRVTVLENNTGVGSDPVYVGRTLVSRCTDDDWQEIFYADVDYPKDDGLLLYLNGGFHVEAILGSDRGTLGAAQTDTVGWVLIRPVSSGDYNMYNEGIDLMITDYGGESGNWFSVFAGGELMAEMIDHLGGQFEVLEL